MRLGADIATSLIFDKKHWLMEQTANMRVHDVSFATLRNMVYLSEARWNQWSREMDKPLDKSEITIRKGGGMSIVGADATNLYRAVMLGQALRMYAKTKMLATRNATPSVMLRMAAEYSGKTYKRGQYVQAADDLQIWIDTMKAALPINYEDEKS
jgi:hypothetical protein